LRPGAAKERLKPPKGEATSRRHVFQLDEVVTRHLHRFVEMVTPRARVEFCALQLKWKTVQALDLRRPRGDSGSCVEMTFVRAANPFRAKPLGLGSGGNR
jgi:hypothetical protein